MCADHARDFIFNMIDTLSAKDQVTCFVSLWAIWYAKRKVIHKGVYQSPLSTYAFIQNFVADLGSAEDIKKKVNNERPLSANQPRWAAPPVGVIKINVDAAVAKNLNKGVVAAVARDSNGVYRGASAAIFHGRSDPETLEALACREAMSLAADIAAPRVQIASDYLSVVKSYNEGSKGTYTHIIQEMMTRGSDFQDFSVIFERRSANKDAHHPARFAVHSEFGRLVWFLDPPEGVNIPVSSEG
jgi:ribonuclease HI